MTSLQTSSQVILVASIPTIVDSNQLFLILYMSAKSTCNSQCNYQITPDQCRRQCQCHDSHYYSHGSGGLAVSSVRLFLAWYGQHQDLEIWKRFRGLISNPNLGSYQNFEVEIIVSCIFIILSSVDQLQSQALSVLFVSVIWDGSIFHVQGAWVWSYDIATSGTVTELRWFLDGLKVWIFWGKINSVSNIQLCCRQGHHAVIKWASSSFQGDVEEDWPLCGERLCASCRSCQFKAKASSGSYGQSWWTLGRRWLDKMTQINSQQYTILKK